MGELIIIDGSGLKATFNDDGVSVVPTGLAEKCDACNDDRLLHEGDLLKCYNCGCINRIP
jgi:hypothetical protein